LAPPDRGAMAITYYHDKAVHISSGGVRTGQSWYPLETLTYVWYRRTGRLRHSSYMLVTRVGAIAFIVAVLVALGIAARRVELSGGERITLLVAGFLVVVVFGTIAGMGVEGLLRVIDRSNERTRGQHEIWIRTSDGEIMIYTTSDRLAFGKVYRALRRAMENA
jgi:hypothetical protein